MQRLEELCSTERMVSSARPHAGTHARKNTHTHAWIDPQYDRFKKLHLCGHYRKNNFRVHLGGCSQIPGLSVPNPSHDNGKVFVGQCLPDCPLPPCTFSSCIPWSQGGTHRQARMRARTHLAQLKMLKQLVSLLSMIVTKITPLTSDAALCCGAPCCGLAQP